MRKKELEERVRQIEDTCGHILNLSVLNLDNAVAVITEDDHMDEVQLLNIRSVIDGLVRTICYLVGPEDENEFVEMIASVAKVVYDQGEEFDDPTYSMEYRLRQYFSSNDGNLTTAEDINDDV